jgi:hypothetical protein
MSREWYLREHGVVIGPLQSQDLKQAASAGRITPRTEVSLDRQKWHKASAIKGLRFKLRVELSPDVESAPSVGASAAASGKALGEAKGPDGGLDLPQYLAQPSEQIKTSGLSQPTFSVHGEKPSSQQLTRPPASSQPNFLKKLAQHDHPAVKALLKHNRAVMGAGCALALISCFFPFASVPFLGRVSYMDYEAGYGIVVLASGIAGLVSVVLTKPKYLLAAAGLLVIVCTYDILIFTTRKQQLLHELQSGGRRDANNPFTQFGVAMASSLARSISLEWAPFLIVLGGLAAVVGGLACLAKDEHPQGV